MYDIGEGVPEDNEEAVRWFRPSADQGFAAAQYNLGVMYDIGEGVREDNEEAVRWYRRAADQGFAAAQHNLGVMYDIGDGVAEDDGQAVRWYRRAAEQGYAIAQFTLAVRYRQGDGVPESAAEAEYWYGLAAEQGNVLAQTNLGVMLTERWYRSQVEDAPADTLPAVGGASVDRDLVLAFMWFTVAAARGGESAQANKDRIEQWLTPEQITETERLAQEWIATHPQAEADASATIGTIR
jgi:TPR repeat protein